MFCLSFISTFDTFITHTDDFTRLVRYHPTVADAKSYVERTASRLCDESSDDFVEEAGIFRIQKDGSLKCLWEFDGHDRGDGRWRGWEKYVEKASFEEDFGALIRTERKLPELYESAFTQEVVNNLMLGTIRGH